MKVWTVRSLVCVSASWWSAAVLGSTPCQKSAEAFPRVNPILLCQSPRCGSEQRWDGELHGQPARLPWQHSAQWERRLLGGHVCGPAQPGLLHAGLPVPATLDQKAPLQGRSAREGAAQNGGVPSGLWSSSEQRHQLVAGLTCFRFFSHLFLTVSLFSTALQSGRSDEVRSSLQFGGGGAWWRRLHPQFPWP